MLSKTKSKNVAIAARSAALPLIPKELIDLFVTGPMSGDAVNAASVWSISGRRRPLESSFPRRSFLRADAIIE